MCVDLLHRHHTGYVHIYREKKQNERTKDAIKMRPQSTCVSFPMKSYSSSLFKRPCFGINSSVLMRSSGPLFVRIPKACVRPFHFSCTINVQKKHIQCHSFDSFNERKKNGGEPASACVHHEMPWFNLFLFILIFCTTYIYTVYILVYTIPTATAATTTFTGCV